MGLYVGAVVAFILAIVFELAKITAGPVTTLALVALGLLFMALAPILGRALPVRRRD